MKLRHVTKFKKLDPLKEVLAEAVALQAQLAKRLVAIEQCLGSGDPRRFTRFVKRYAAANGVPVNTLDKRDLVTQFVGEFGNVAVDDGTLSIRG